MGAFDARESCVRKFDGYADAFAAQFEAKATRIVKEEVKENVFVAYFEGKDTGEKGDASDKKKELRGKCHLCGESLNSKDGMALFWLEYGYVTHGGGGQEFPEIRITIIAGHEECVRAAEVEWWNKGESTILPVLVR